VAFVIVGGELLIMWLINAIHANLVVNDTWSRILFLFIDPLALTLLATPALYLLVFRPMRAQHLKLQLQMDELSKFQRFSIGRELRMKELVEENDALRGSPSPQSSENSSNVSAGEMSERSFANSPSEQGDRDRAALLFMMEDLENAHKK